MAFPAEKADQWYGWSADTHERGLKKLLDLEYVERMKTFTKAPLAPAGYTEVYRYQRTAITRPRKARKTTAQSVTKPATAKKTAGPPPDWWTR